LIPQDVLLRFTQFKYFFSLLKLFLLKIAERRFTNKTNMKSLTIALIAVMTLSLLAMPLVMAVGQQAGVNSGLSTQNQGTETSLQNQAQVQSGTYANENGQQMQIQAGEGNQVRLQSEGVEANSNMIMTREQAQDKTKLMVHLSNGMNSEVKIMPNTASETALARLGAKCEDRNCTIELKEVGTGNQTRAAYEIKTQKQSKILGLFQAKMQVQAQVDAENGEVIQTKKPWWAFLATESA